MSGEAASHRQRRLRYDEFHRYVSGTGCDSVDIRRPARGRVTALLALLALVLLGLGLLGLNRGLWTPDEPREAEIGREMWLAPAVIPTLDGQPFIEKPPLYYWAVAAAYRVGGGPSALAARLVSVLAGLATLWLVFLWGARGHSRLAGALAAVMLATSLQFAVSTHWVLLDPLLMLFTTAATWAAWGLLDGRDSARLRKVLYGALILALWTKGPIGVVLVGAGLGAYMAIERPRSWRYLHPVRGLCLLAAAALLLAAAIAWQGGRAALWEWFWVNQVQRLASPLARTGHRQPLLYYLWTLPYAVLPWLVVLLDALRPSRWRRGDRAHALWRYAAISSAGMLVVLSVASTKRETYLLPLLPLLFLWLGIHAARWWRERQAAAAPAGTAWWLQSLLLAVLALGPPLALCLWSRRVVPLAVLWAVAAIAVLAWLVQATWRRRWFHAGIAALGCAVVGMGALLSLAPALNGMKDMGPFVTGIGRELPPGAPVYATGIDETLRAIVPFCTGRRLLPFDAGLQRQEPPFILVQNNHGAAVRLPPSYRLERRQAFGPGRELQWWRRQPQHQGDPL